jgi:hypothetical protein
MKGSPDSGEAGGEVKTPGHAHAMSKALPGPIQAPGQRHDGRVDSSLQPSWVTHAAGTEWSSVGGSKVLENPASTNPPKRFHVEHSKPGGGTPAPGGGSSPRLPRVFREQEIPPSPRDRGHETAVRLQPSGGARRERVGLSLRRAVCGQEHRLALGSDQDTAPAGAAPGTGTRRGRLQPVPGQPASAAPSAIVPPRPDRPPTTRSGREALRPPANPLVSEMVRHIPPRRMVGRRSGPERHRVGP